MNGEDFCRVLLERSSRPLRPTRPALARSRSLVRSLARPPGHTGPAASRGEPVRRHDEWSAHYGEVPATKSRDEMSPFACERRVSIRRGEARRDRDSGEVDTGRPTVRPLDERRQSGGADVPSLRSLDRIGYRFDP